MRRRSREPSGNQIFIPKGRITTAGKENNRTTINIPKDGINLQRKNLLEKFNKQKYDPEDYMIGSNSGSVILNSSDIEDCSEKKKI